LIPHHGDDEPLMQSQLILGSIFKQAYETVRKSAKAWQRGTPLKWKAIWVVFNKKKFQGFVSEIKGLNDNLEILFPDIAKNAVDNMKGKISQSDDIHALQSLQEATTEEHEEILATTSIRLEAIGATARSWISENFPTIVQGNGLGQVEVDTIEGTEDSAMDGLGEIAQKMKEVELYVSKRSEGTLTLSLSGPYSHSTCVSAHVYWDGQRSESFSSYWDDQEKGFAKSSHSSFSLTSYTLL